MAAESWYSETPEQAKARHVEAQRARLAELGRFKNTPDMPRRVVRGPDRTQEEMELLLEHAHEELAFGGPEQDAANPHQLLQRRLATYATDPRFFCMGVIETLRWLLGRRDTGPLTNEVYDRPLDGRALGHEYTRAQDIIERNPPHWNGDEDLADFAAGLDKTLSWYSGGPRPLYFQPGGDFPQT
jgi:hypothetical protein